MARVREEGATRWAARQQEAYAAAGWSLTWAFDVPRLGWCVVAYPTEAMRAFAAGLPQVPDEAFARDDYETIDRLWNERARLMGQWLDEHGAAMLCDDLAAALALVEQRVAALGGPPAAVATAGGAR